MSKKRTREEKSKAKHTFVFSQSEASVKWHLSTPDLASELQINPTKKADNSSNSSYFETAKKRMIKSLILVSLILALEVVLYFVIALNEGR